VSAFGKASRSNAPRLAGSIPVRRANPQHSLCIESDPSSVCTTPTLEKTK